ncbi:ankyrin-1-like [Vigna umbellata]|uniref:ankyrin-1-like n=1 Tax=Vigna umbellata TaxID=87088 RepID=UPI001F5FE536|nr:ankyrin-1-like [Vigna umbellata]
MDGRMTKAAETGNVDELERLMREDILVLDSIALHGAQTPLHIASMCGHVSFVQEMLKLKKQFVYELNQDGFTAMHLASANGHVQVVLELLKVDHQLCQIQGREGTLPLHCASVKGRIHVMTALLSAAPLTVQSKTARGETPLHIAVKNNHFDAVKLLLEHAKGLKMERVVLNDKDNQANTVLHLAASRKQYQVSDSRDLSIVWWCWKSFCKEMDGRMTKAAETGNVDELERLMREDILVLDSIALHGAQTPLHIASMCGHVSFVQEMLKLKKQFVYELNQDGFTAMHLASANGHVQVVLELLKVDHQLCQIQGREGTLPLHCASVKGRIHVMTALLSAAPLTVQSKTARGETPLHIAVKNNHFDAVKLLLEHAKGLKMERVVLNDKDNQANTVLHLAASRKQYQVSDSRDLIRSFT